MKKFDLRGVKEVFANLRGGEKGPSKGDLEIQETLQPHDFYCGKLMRHGFPYHPTCMAWDPVQKLLAIGTKHGAIRLLGRPGVDITIQHDSDVIVLQIAFLINEGAFITACADDSVHLWSYRQKTPEIVHSLKFSRERITCVHLPYQSKWLYLGTERGNVHIVNVETFTVCGYTINWNKAIEIARKTHPGPVVHLSDNPLDANKLLIGFETGLVVCWDLRCKMAEYRFHCPESLRDASWHQEGKLFMCSHADGTITTWNFRQQAKPVSIMAPHSKVNKTGKNSPCKPINRLEWKSMKNGEPYVIFSGGMSYEASKSPCLTIMHGKSVTVLEMEHQIIDFIVLCNNVFSYEFDDPYAIIVLLSSDLIFIDMTTPGYPCFQCPYALDIHESPVTCLKFYSDCASDLIPAFYSCGSKQKRKGFSDKEFPVTGGQWGAASCSYFEMLITGHADGSVKFWDVSGINLQFLYRMKTNKLFEKLKKRDIDEEDVLAIQHIYLDEESRLLAVAASHHIVLFSFSKKETTKDIAVVEVTAVSEVFEETAAFDCNTESESYRDRSAGLNSSNHNSSGLPGGTSANLDPSRMRLPSGSSTEQDNAKTADTTDGYNNRAAHDQPQHSPQDQTTQGTTTQGDVSAGHSPISPEDEGSDIFADTEELSIENTAAMSPDRLRCKSSSSPVMNQLNHNGHRPLSKTMSDQPTHLQVSGPDADLAAAHGTVTAGGEGHKASWKRRLSIKVGNMTGLSVKQKTPHSTKSFTAAPHHPNSAGFFADQRKPRTDKTDGVFSRSRSSSTNSLDGAGVSDVVQFVMFADGYTRKQDQETTPGLWIGTNNGTVIAMNVNLPGSERASQPVVVSHSGSTFQMKGTILELCFLNYNGLLIPVEAEVWSEGRDSSDKREKRSKLRVMHSVSSSVCSTSSTSSIPSTPPLSITGGDKPRRRLVSRMSRSSMSATEQAERASDKHIAVVCSDCEIRCISLPSQNTLYKERFNDSVFVVKAEAIIVKDSVCLATLASNGHLMVYSLPSLRPLLNINYIRQFDVRVARTLDFGNHGHAIYMCTATEIQKITVSADMCRQQADMQCEPFIVKANPEAPKQSFLKNLFGSGPSVLDRQELFGGAGKASHGLATLVPGTALQAANANATGLAGDLARTRMALDERGEKLGKLEDRTEALRDRAREFSSNASMLANKYKDQKWYQL